MEGRLLEGGPSIEGALIKKLITCSDSAVVEAYKVLDNNVAINRFLRIWEYFKFFFKHPNNLGLQLRQDPPGY